MSASRVSRDGRVDHDGVYVGSVRRVDSIRTGWRCGRCIGQVPCVRYEATAADGKAIRIYETGGYWAGHLRRADAVAALVAYATTGTP